MVQISHTDVTLIFLAATLVNRNMIVNLRVSLFARKSMKISKSEFNYESEWGYEFEYCCKCLSEHEFEFIWGRFLKIDKFRKAAFLVELCNTKVSPFFISFPLRLPLDWLVHNTATACDWLICPTVNLALTHCWFMSDFDLAYCDSFQSASTSAIFFLSSQIDRIRLRLDFRLIEVGFKRSLSNLELVYGLYIAKKCFAHPQLVVSFLPSPLPRFSHFVLDFFCGECLGGCGQFVGVLESPPQNCVHVLSEDRVLV